MNDDNAADASPNGQEENDIVDSLPSDLDHAAVSEPYLFPNNSRRRICAVLYLLIGLVCLLAVVFVDADIWIFNDAFFNNGVLIGGIVLILLGLYHAQAGWDLSCDEEQALQAAVRDVGFPVGHASAQLGWRGLRSRPTWRVLLYSNEPSPTHRGLVLVDGIDGEIISRFVETNPEDWTKPPNYANLRAKEQP